MMSRLQAEESLQAVSEIAVGSGALKVTERRKILSEWMRLAGQKKAKLSVDQQAAMLASMGVRLECQNN